jgi:hypothetical protein
MKAIAVRASAGREMQDLAEEQLGALVLRIVEELVWLVLLDDLALIHEDHPVGNLPGEAHFVGHAEHGHAFFSQIHHGVEHFLDHLRIERRCRLVETA